MSRKETIQTFKHTLKKLQLWNLKTPTESEKKEKEIAHIIGFKTTVQKICFLFHVHRKVSKSIFFHLTSFHVSQGIGIPR